VRSLRTLERYLARQIYGAVGFILFAFLALFAFFDLIKELTDLDKGEYQLRQVFTFVMLSLPAHAYELFPVVVLIGTLYVLSHLASNSEYTVMRGSGLSPARAALALFKIGLAFVVLTFVLGEWLAPSAEEMAQKTKLRALSSMIGQDLQSGLWFKDEGSFINVREARQASQLGGVRIFDFDGAYRVRAITSASTGSGSTSSRRRCSSSLRATARCVRGCSSPWPASSCTPTMPSGDWHWPTTPWRWPGGSTPRHRVVECIPAMPQRAWQRSATRAAPSGSADTRPGYRPRPCAPLSATA